MIISEKRQAEGILLVKNIFSGLFPVLTVIAYTNHLLPLSTLAWSYIVATIFFAIILTAKKEWKKNVTNTQAIKDITLAVLLIAIGYYLLYYIALSLTSPQNVALISMTEAAFSFIIIGWIAKKEPVSRNHFFGAMLMLFAAGVVLFNNHQASINIGDLLMLCAVIIAPIGNIFAKRALHQVSLYYLLFLRSLTGAIIFFVASLIFEKTIPLEVILKSSPYLLYSGLVFLGLMKMINLFSFKKTSVTHTISFNSLAPVFTFIFAWMILKNAPSTVQIFAIIPSLLGLFLLTIAKQKQTQYGFEEVV
ncbi:MAG: DMT family transporter [Parcubacteria group bacterium]|jgi:drug/metabolite transporter (DMT)-like permease